MNSKKSWITTIFLVGLLICFSITTITHAATWSGISPIPLDGNFELVSSSYDYNPALNTLTKTYRFKNITGSTITNPRIITLFTWSNDICSTSWQIMNYDGSAMFSNSAQSATIEDQDGLFNWNALISSPTPPLDSSGFSSSLPLQSTQAGVSYPYMNICTTTPDQWADDEVATISLSFGNVLNPYWVQSLSWLVTCSGGDCPAIPDADSDGRPDCNDNCPNKANAGQEDLFPPGGNGIGDACDCEADFTCDGDVDADDVTAFLKDFGREPSFKPCTNVKPCNGDFNCDVDVDADDVSKFIEDFGREPSFKPCPACTPGAWCSY